MLLDKMSQFRHYKRCLVCNSLFDSSRNTGISLGIKQFSGIRFCSIPCSRIYNRTRQVFTCRKNVCSVSATNTGKIFYFDKPYLNIISQYSWYEDSLGYAQTCGDNTRKHVRLHSLIMGHGNGLVIDHIDRDKTNNRVSNLRFVTVAQNIRNQSDKTSSKSGYRGIYQQMRQDGVCYSAELIYNKKKYYLGRFKNIKEAHKARRSKITELDLGQALKAP